MGVATYTPTSLLSHSDNSHHPVSIIKGLNSLNSMSQGFHPGIYSFSNGFDTSLAMHQQDHQHQQQQQQHHIVQQQTQRNKLLTLRGFEPAPSLVGIDEEETGDQLPVVYETGGMLSEMFNFQSGAAAPPPAELLENQIQESYRLHRSAAATPGSEWYGSRHGMVSGLGPLYGDSKQNHGSNNNNRHNITQHHHQISSMNADSAAAMQLFLQMKPQPRSPSPPPAPPSASSTTALHFLLPNQSTASPPQLQGFHTAFDSTPIPPPQFTWVPDSSTGGDSTAAQLNNRSKIDGGAGENQGQGLSLSLSPLQHLEAAKAEELRIGDGAVLYYNQDGGASSANSFQLKNLENHHQQQFHLQGLGQNHHVHVGFSPSLGMANVLRNSKYLKAAQELLEEFCSVGRGQLKTNRLGRPNTNPNSNQSSAAAAAGSSSSSSKDLAPLSAADRIQHQRKKAALLSIMEEVDRRYNHYCGQMQMVVNSFDSIMGYGAARPYTALAQKAMSRHFRCLKDAIAQQLRQTRELLGEKEGVGASGITKGETPRLKFVDQSIRQQRAFHQIGMMEQEAWRPQRGLPERSVNILRAWLFEHFLHPYPSDADKHLLARQTGLSRNQVSNWFINARVRLWKPMVEEMYQQESKDEDEEEEEEKEEREGENHHGEERERPRKKQVQGQGQSSSSAPTPTTTSAAGTGAGRARTTTTAAQPTTITTTAAGKRSEIDASENDPSLNVINVQRFSENQAIGQAIATTIMATNSIPLHNDLSPTSSSHHRFPPTLESASALHPHRQHLVSLIQETRRHGGGGGGFGVVDAHDHHYGTSTNSSATTTPSTGANPNIDSTLLMFGSSATTTGDHVSLTLGLRHAGNLPAESNRFPLSDFGSC